MNIKMLLVYLVIGENLQTLVVQSDHVLALNGFYSARPGRYSNLS
jgi:hypothetical protein